ncbi:JAB domain-containing protein [Thermoflexibacter ruber]|nr:JAB domain-containing protein [Thermoflexibacter ruber]
MSDVKDLQLTQKLKEAGKFLEIPVLDHIIFTDHSFFLALLMRVYFDL